MVAALSAVVCAGAMAPAAIAPASAASPHILYIRPGDGFIVKGTTLTCQVFTSQPIALQCANSATTKSLVPDYGSYGIGVDADAAAIFRVEPHNAPVELRYPEPSVSGAMFATPTSKKGTDWTVTPPTGILVAGTHIFCAADVAAVAGLNVTCGLSTVADQLQYPAGSYVVSFSDKFVLLGKAKAGGGGLTTLAYKAQPKPKG